MQRKQITLIPKEVDSRNVLNELSGEEWLYFTKTIIATSYPSEYGHELRKEHGANKPPQLMKQLIEFFTKSKQLVLDPFAGVGGTLIGASLCDRECIGIEINMRWVDIYEKVCKKEGIKKQRMILGDCLEELPKFEEESFDFVATDPPYSIKLEKTMCDGKYDIQNRKTDFNGFSDDKRDFSNFESFEEFFDGIEMVGKEIFRVLKKQKYLVIILRDAYQDGEYIETSCITSQRMKKVGFKLKGVKIWYQSGTRVRPYGYPYSYVPNIAHQNILIFRKEV